MNINKSVVKTLLMAFVLGSASLAGAALVEDTVSSRDNLFFTDWNGFFNPPPPDFEAPGSEAAQAVGGYDFIANGIAAFNISISGEVIDAGALATGPDGCPDPQAACYFNPNNNNGIYNFQPAYSVIGVWSTTADEINFITPEGGSTWIDALVYVGSGGTFEVPDSALYASAYLFLGENDGNFEDNLPIGFYDVTVSNVPVPAAAWLFGSALLSLGVMARRRRP